MSQTLWSPTGDLATPQEKHSATLLQSGQVLVAGGNSATAELYDPASGEWSATGSLHTARYLHSATLLQSGQVLVVGGLASDSSSFLASAELYDPTTGTWTPTGAMTTGRVGHTATLLPSGEVLVTGGHGTDYVASIEVYDPVVGQWSPAGALATARWKHTATLISPFLLLIAGGQDERPSSLASAELVDLTRGTSTALSSMWAPRASHTASLLQSGEVLVAGGSDSPNLSLSSAELFDPGSQKWTPTAPLTTRRTYHTATVLPSGQVFLTGGVDLLRGPQDNPAGLTLDTAEVFDRASQTWTATGSMGQVRALHTASLLQSGKVLVSGGNQAFGTGADTATAEIFDPAGGNPPRISPANPSVAPNSSLTFSASGGSGTGYVWSFGPNRVHSGALTSNGVYTAAQYVGDIDVIRLTDSAGNAASTVIGVEPLLAVSPSSGTLAPGATQVFSPSGGLAPYTWAFVQNASGGSLSNAGVYKAGPTGGVTDIVGVTDYIGVTSTATMKVTESTTGGGCETVGGGQAPLLVVAIVLTFWRRSSKRTVSDDRRCAC